MKKTLVILSIVLLLTSTLFAGGVKENQSGSTLKVGATPEPHAAFLELVKQDLQEQGINLEIIEFTDYVTPNKALEDGQIDANFFQHIPYLESFNEEQGYHLVNAGGIHIEPIALYSKKYSSVEALPTNASIAIPNDPTNGGRALLLLQSYGLITLNEGAGITATALDIASNPHNFSFKEIEAASLPRVLEDVDAAVINGNYAIPAGLKANVDGLLIEGSDSPYVNVVAVKEGNENNANIKALVAALQSDTIKDYVAEKYPNGEVVVVF
jgi:D-methionine transport system substrate-binding protein